MSRRSDREGLVCPHCGGSGEREVMDGVSWGAFGPEPVVDSGTCHCGGQSWRPEDYGHDELAGRMPGSVRERVELERYHAAIRLRLVRERWCPARPLELVAQRALEEAPLTGAPRRTSFGP